MEKRAPTVVSKQQDCEVLTWSSVTIPASSVRRLLICETICCCVVEIGELQQEGMRRFPLRYSEKIRASQLVRLATQEDIVTISAIEEDSFPEDEKATLETIQMRYETAGKYFHVLVDEKNSGGEIIGYVNGTCIEENYITHESMETHNPNGSTLVLHSVTVKSSHRRQGQANFLLRAYLELMESQREINLILLLCKSNLCRFYSKCGFQMVGVSPVVHGQDPWFEMSFDVSRARLLTQYQVDAFTSKGFHGNSASVVLGMRSAEWMQKMGMENNLSETSFLRPVLSSEEQNHVATYDLRWFTPSIEVALCGHATLAAAHVLFEHSYLNPPSPSVQTIDTICFNTLSRGQLRAQRIMENGNTFIELDFPSQPPSPHEFSETEMSALCQGFRISSNDILYAGKSIDDALLVVSPETFAQIPSLASGLLNINAIGSIDSRGVIVTCVGPSSSLPSPFAETFPEANFLSRFFAPQVGVNEDPVTGSAHTVLAPYWCEKLGKNKLMGYQHSQRGGWVGVRQEGDRIFLTGQCVSIKESTILIDET